MPNSSLNSFNSFFTHQLNDSQKEAVSLQFGSLLVVAGAGSGKTRIIIARIAHLILNGHVDPESIVVLTFTNKAANEMKGRIVQFVNDGNIVMPFVGTFHGYCLRLLRKNTHLLSRPFTSILDQEDKGKILANIIQSNGLHKKITAKKLSYQISDINNQPDSKSKQTLLSVNPLLSQLYTAYEQEKKVNDCFDFDDLLTKAVELITTNQEFKLSLQKQIKHLLVDEYQDTNAVQHALLKQISLKTDSNKKKQLAIDSLCVVGDEDQSIYSWRGATVANISNFTTEFHGTRVIKIEQNYRSVSPILDVANEVIYHNEGKNPKKLWSTRTGEDRVRVLVTASGYGEAQVIAQFINKAHIAHKAPSIGVLYRTHFQSRIIEEMLVKHHIPYRIIGGTQFYERKEIKDILAYIRLIVNPFDRTSLFRVINCPQRGLGIKFEELFKEQWQQEPLLPFTEVCKKLIDENLVTAQKKDSLTSFVSVFKKINPTMQPSTALEIILQETAYKEYIQQNYDISDAKGRLDNIKELLNSITYLEEKSDCTINHFLDEVSLMQFNKKKQDETSNPVTLMSLHAAKGLEFDIVIIAGIEEGLMPSSQSLGDIERIKEERRLFYVGITRAKERLLLTHVRHRYRYGSMEEKEPSRFLEEIPNHCVKKNDGTHWNAEQFDHFFSNWLGISTKSINNNSQSVNTYGTYKNKVSNFKQSQWKKHQPVIHKIFGVGIIEQIEQRGPEKVYLTIQFKSARKKLDAAFVKHS